MTNEGLQGGDQVILATGGYDHTIKIWQAHTGVCQRTAQHADSQVNALEITPDKQHIAAAGYQHIRMYDMNSNNANPVINYEGLTKNVTSVGFQEDGKWMYTGGEDCSARIWDLRSRNMQCQRIFQVSAPVNCVCLHPNQAELIVGDQSGIIHIWDLKTDHNEQLFNLTVRLPIKTGPQLLLNKSLAWHKDYGWHVKVAGQSKSLCQARLLFGDNRGPALNIPEADAAVLSMAVDAEGTYLAAVNNKGRCFVWSLGGGTAEEPTRLNPRHRLEAHKRHALKCRFSPDSTLLVTTSADHTARVWRTADFSMVQELTCDAQRWVWDAAFSADSQYIVTASSDGVARLWDVATGTVQREYTGHQKAITALALEEITKD